MRSNAIKQHKIFNAVIISNFVNMMNNFFSCQIPAKMFFHDKSMFKDVRIFSCVGMVGLINHYIPARMFSNPSFPILTLRSFFTFLITVITNPSFSIRRQHFSFIKNSYFSFSFFSMRRSWFGFTSIVDTAWHELNILNKFSFVNGGTDNACIIN